MGVPKFFRYISERYPCLSEIVKEHQVRMKVNMNIVKSFNYTLLDPAI